MSYYCENKRGEENNMIRKESGWHTAIRSILIDYYKIEK